MQPNSLLPRLTSLRNTLQRTVQSGMLSNEARLPQVCRMTTQNGAHGELFGSSCIATRCITDMQCACVAVFESATEAANFERSSMQRG
jgi:hypothetical protein